MKIDGSCHCGAVRFEAIVTPGTVWLCHCSDCQTLTGSPYRSTLLARKDTFSVDGELTSYVRTTDEGFEKRLFFCGRCGSPIYGTDFHERAEFVSLRVGTIRQRAELGPPALQMWCHSALDWALLATILMVEKQA